MCVALIAAVWLQVSDVQILGPLFGTGRSNNKVCELLVTAVPSQQLARAATACSKGTAAEQSIV